MLISRILISRHMNIKLSGNRVISVESLTNALLKMYSSNPVKTIPAIEKSFHERDFIEKSQITSARKFSKPVIYTFTFLGLSITLLGTYVVVEFFKPEALDTDRPLWQQYLLEVWKRIQRATVLIQEPSREKLLPDPVPYPYYQPPYTLVLEFTDVLAHPDWTYNTGWRFKKRPGLDYMLENLVGHYEIVVFTAEPGMTIFPVIEALDSKSLISYKLVRDSTHFVDGHHIKNLDRLNRDLKRVIVVDWNSLSLKFQPDNHLKIPRWKGENEDLTLVDLTAFLKTIAQTEIEDVRDVLRFYKQFEDPLGEFRNKQREYLEQKEKVDAQPEKQTQSIKKVFSYIM
ncbi:hypothetical protein JTB14_015470 [Gonioctena quinquepunctata]|nr:hypothetical protein JTB14_015470 [Gonioctena quinquepunctata]